MSDISYSATRDSITVVVTGTAHVVRKGTANYAKLKQALHDERWDDVPGLLTVEKTIEGWSNGEFAVVKGVLQYQGEKAPDGFSRRVLAMLTAGEDAQPLLNGFERLDRNPSSRSVAQLPAFLVHEGIPFEPQGTFLAYKSVRSNYQDHHSGKLSNKPGTVLKVKRNRVSDDPNHSCHFGLHVGALKYAQDFGAGGRIVIVRVDPEHVVCVPHDSSSQKMRVCQYEVVGDWNGRQMPSTVMETDAARDQREGTTPKAAEPKAEPAPKPKAAKPKANLPKPKAKAKGKAKPKAKAKFVPDKNLKRKWRRWDAKDEVDLLEIDIMSLRQYATYHIKLVGASKIPGGKTALARNIIEVRDGEGHK